ncbi:MAG: ABC transporter substrate-binding protein [Treponema sp.]|jgi:NitT/TauT family transport system substrate-binding protein|nr:ABC transporter substrate-binding protein [Treponema sp.]
MKNRKSSFNPAGLALPLLAVLLGSLALSCAKKTVAADAEPMTIIYNSNVLTIPIVAVARERHYFEEEGLDPEFIILASGAIEALSIGKADIMLTGIIPSLSYAAQGADVKVIGGTISGGNFAITRPENRAKYARLEDWRGARLGTVRLSTSEMVSRFALGQIGLNTDASSQNQDVTFVEIENYPNIIEGVRKGQVDIGFVSYEYRQAVEDLGLTILFPMTSMYPNYVCCRETAYTKSLETKRSIFVKFLQAQIRAFKEFVEKPDDTVALIARLSSQEPDFVRNALYDPDRSAGRTYHPDPDLRRVRDVYATLQEHNYIPLGLAVEDVLDYTLYQDALQNILERYPDDPFYRQLARDFEFNNLNL